MEKWREICGQQAARLKSVLEVYKHAEELARHGGARNSIKGEDMRKLEDTRKTIMSKLPRLERGEFHIAVVGAEKAGKSTFINAWIGSDLLPNKSDRCTFTTTKLHSVMNENEQRLEVETKTEAEFEKLIKDLKEQSNSPVEIIKNNARKDLALIEENKDNMLGLVGHEIDPIPFQRLEDIQTDLEHYAADGRYAHAIREVNLHTKSLASMDGILFYDVPGIDSGLELHTEETKKMLEDSDAVIMVKRFGDPSIKGHEQTILHYANSGDVSVKLKDKLFFFLSRIDDAKTRNGFLEDQEKIYKECDAYGIDRGKIVFGAAVVPLLLTDKLNDTLHVASKSELKKSLRVLLDLPDEEDETILRNSGVPELKNRMESYLQNERENILRASCDKLINDLLESARNIYNDVRKIVPDNPVALRMAHGENIKNQLYDWFTNRWEEITDELDHDDAKTLVTESIEAMRSGYAEKAHTSLAKLKTYDPDYMNRFFGSQRTHYGASDFAVMNANIRKEINEEAIIMLQELSSSLTSDLYDRLMGYIDYLDGKFNHALNITELLLEAMEAETKENYKQQLGSALSALYLRFARPLARGLLQYRHGIEERKEDARSNYQVYYTLAGYYPDDAPGQFAKLPAYIGGIDAIKARPVVDAAKEVAVDAAKKATSKAAEKLLKRGVGTVAGGTMGGPIGAAVGAVAGDVIIDGAASAIQGRPADALRYESIQDVVDELEKDRSVLDIYLSDAVFSCSGIDDYAEAELERIRRFFIKIKGRIHMRVENSYEFRNERLLEILPPELQNAECDTKVSDLLQQLNIALNSR